jgi:transposase
MLQIDFTPEAIAQLQYERYQHPHPRVQMKMDALLLKARGLPHQQIATVVGVSHNTLLAYFRAYQAGGIEVLRAVRFRRPASALAAQGETLESYFAAHPPATIGEAVAVIERLTGLRRSHTQVAVFLKKQGLKRRRVYPVPAKLDEERQDAFKKTNLSHDWRKQRRKSGQSTS